MCPFTLVLLPVVACAQTYNPLHVQQVFARDPVSMQWVLLVYNSDVYPPVPQTGIKANIFSPTPCSLPFATNTLRIETAASGQSWTELDAVRVVGTPTYMQDGGFSNNSTDSNAWVLRSVLDVRDPQGRVWLRAPTLSRSDVSFNFIANSCKYFSVYRQIGVSMEVMTVHIDPVNHPPLVANASIDTDATGKGIIALHQADWDDVLTAASNVSISGTISSDSLRSLSLPTSHIGLTAIDPDGDIIWFELKSLPERGRIYIIRAESNHTAATSQGNITTHGPLTQDALPLLLPGNAVLWFEPSDVCDFNTDGPFLPVSFQYDAVDSGAKRSLLATVTVRQYCLRLESLPVSLTRTLLILMAMGVFACLVMGGCMWGHRAEPMIAASSPLFHLISLVGCIGLFVTILPLVQSKLSVAWCMVRWCLPCICATLLFAALFAKTLRVYRVFMNQSLSRVPYLSDRELIQMVCVFVSVTALFLLLFGLLDPPQVQYDYTLDEQHTAHSVCSNSRVFRPLLLSWLLALVGATSVLTFQSRKVPSAYQESSIIGFTVYNALVCGALGIGLDFALEGNRSAQVIFLCFLLLGALGCSVAALFGTKLFQFAQLLSEMRSDPMVQIAELRRRLFSQFYSDGLDNGLPAQLAQQQALSKVEKYIQTKLASGTAGADVMGPMTRKDIALRVASLLSSELADKSAELQLLEPNPTAAARHPGGPLPHAAELLAASNRPHQAAALRAATGVHLAAAEPAPAANIADSVERGEASPSRAGLARTIQKRGLSLPANASRWPLPPLHVPSVSMPMLRLDSSHPKAARGALRHEPSGSTGGTGMHGSIDIPRHSLTRENPLEEADEESGNKQSTSIHNGLPSPPLPQVNPPLPSNTKMHEPVREFHVPQQTSIGYDSSQHSGAFYAARLPPDCIAHSTLKTGFIRVPHPLSQLPQRACSDAPRAAALARPQMAHFSSLDTPADSYFKYVPTANEPHPPPSADPLPRTAESFWKGSAEDHSKMVDLLRLNSTVSALHLNEVHGNRGSGHTHIPQTDSNSTETIHLGEQGQNMHRADEPQSPFSHSPLGSHRYEDTHCVPDPIMLQSNRPADAATEWSLAKSSQPSSAHASPKQLLENQQQQHMKILPSALTPHPPFHDTLKLICISNNNDAATAVGNDDAVAAAPVHVVLHMNPTLANHSTPNGTPAPRAPAL
jgi:hypothetical protein